MKNRLIFILFLIAAALAAASAFFLFPKVEGDVATQSLLGAALATGVAVIGSVWFFLTSVKSFKAALRPVYYLLAAGIVFMSLLQLVVPLQILFFGVGILQSFIITILWLLGAVAVYLAIRTFARLINVKTKWSSLGLIAGLTVAGGVMSAVVSQIAIESLAQAPAFDRTITLIVLGIVGADGMLNICAAVLALRIRQAVSVAFKAPLLWLALSQLFFAADSIQQILLNTVPGLPASWYWTSGIGLWIPLMAALAMMRSAYLFKEVGQPTDALPPSATPLDNVMYAAQLVSNPRDINETLDKVRQLTASAGVGAKLSAMDNATLKGVYLQVEEYLVTREPLRKFDKEYLRSRLSEEFRQKLDSQPA